MASREAVSVALAALVQGAYPWPVRAVSRKLVMWDQAPKEARPMAYIYEGGANDTTWSNNAVYKSEKNYKIFVYTFDGAGTIGATLLNNIHDALEAAINKPDNLVTNQNTLGGLVYSCRIQGNVLAVPGDIDKDGVLMVPVRVVLPQN